MANSSVVKLFITSLIVAVVLTPGYCQVKQINTAAYVDSTNFQGWSGSNAGDWINSALASLPSSGGKVLLIPGTYSVSTTIRLSKSDLIVQCLGGRVSFNTSNGACRLNWTGPAGGTVVNVDTANTSGIGGDGIDGLTINCASSAAIGLRIYSERNGRFKHTDVFDCTSFGVDLGVNSSIPDTSALTSANVFEDMNVFTASVSGMTAWRLSGTANYDTAGNTFIDVGGTGGLNGDGYRLENSDNNRWLEVNGAASGTGYPLHLTCMAGATSQNMCAREETFYGVNLGPIGVKQDGVGSFFATSNRIYGYELCNGSPVPTSSTIGGSATIDVLDCGDTNFSTYYFTNQGGNLYRMYSNAAGKPLNWLLVPNGYAGWTFGTNSTNGFGVFDAGGNSTRVHLLPTVAGNAETHFNSVGVSPVEINADIGSGTGGLELWSGGASPTKIGKASAIVASGSTTLGAATIPSGSCATTLSPTASSVIAGDTIVWSYTSFASPSTDGRLILNQWATAGHINFSLCNPTSTSITPSGLGINWKVLR